MGELSCEFARQTGTGGIIRCAKQSAAPPKEAAKGKKKKTAPAQTDEMQSCGHQRYCPAKGKCILTEQAANCPKRKE